MKKIEIWSHTIAFIFFAIMMVMALPVIYPIMQSQLFSNNKSMLQLMDTFQLQNSWATIQEKLDLFQSNSEVDAIKEQLYEPLGILYVKSEYANVRNSPEVRNDNIDGEATKGQYLLYFDTEQVDHTTWYLIQQRDDLASGWISGLTLDVISTNSAVIEDKKELSEFFASYLQAAMDSVATYDFSKVQPFLLSDSLIYNESANYLKYLEQKQIEEELLAFELVDAWKVGDHTIWIRTIECYNIIYGDGSEQQKNFVSEYMMSVTENGYQLNRLLGTYEQ